MASPMKPRPLRLRFHAVSIAADPNGCALAKSLEGVRLLSLEAPRLPLVGCATPASCSCKYEHHTDRRAGPRRSEGHTPRIGPGALEVNRRRLRGRRDADYADE